MYFILLLVLILGCTNTVDMVKKFDITETPFGICSDPDVLKAPHGALKQAKNCIINRDGILEARNGANEVSLSGSNLSYVYEMFNFDDDLLLFDDSSDYWEFLGNLGNLIQDEDSNNPALFPGYSNSLSTRGNLYVPCDDGVRKITGASSTNFFKAGLNYEATVLAVAVYGGTSPYDWLANNYYVKYRVTIQRTDVNNVVLESPPSHTHSVQNTTGAARGTDVDIAFSDYALTGDVIRVFRSVAASSLQSIGDSYYLVYEHVLTSADIATGYIAFYDPKPDSELSESLYTNPENEGILKANAPPPVSKCISQYKKSTFYSNVIEPPRVIFTMTNSYADLEGVATGAGVRVSSTNTTNGSPNLTGIADDTGLEVGQFVTGTGIPSGARLVAVTGGGAGTATMDMNATATATNDLKYIDAIIFGYGSTYYAMRADSGDIHTAFLLVDYVFLDYLTNGIDDDFIVHITDDVNYGYSGIGNIKNTIVVERRTLNSSTFYVWATHGESYEPELSGPTYSGGFVYSTANGLESDMLVKPNREYWSKSDQPEHVPIVNWHDIGDSSPIIQTVETKDGRIIFKFDGVYSVTGDGAYSRWTIRTIDKGTTLVCPNAAVHVDGYVYAFTNKGFVRVNMYGVEPISVPYIDLGYPTSGYSLTERAQYFIDYFRQGNTVRQPHVVYNPRGNSIIITLGTSNSNTQYALVYNLKTKAFTDWYFDNFIYSIIANKSDSNYLYYGGRYSYSPDYTVNLWKDNDTRGANYARSVTVDSKPDSTTINFTTDHYAVVGDYVVDGSEQQEILEVTDSDTVVVADNTNISGACTIYTSIESVIEWLPKYGSTRTLKKRFLAMGLGFLVNPAEYSVEYIDGGDTYGPFELDKTTDRRLIPHAAARRYFIEPKITIVDLVNEWQLTSLSIEYLMQEPRGVR